MTTTLRNFNDYSVDVRDKYSRDIWRESEKRVWKLSRKGRNAIDERQRELDHEWDIDSLLKLQACAFATKFLIFGSIVNKKYFYGAALVAVAALQQSVQGWSPPYQLYRMMGKRTKTEIEDERKSLEAIRGQSV